MNILITGASGFIGSKLIQKLDNNNNVLRVLARKKYLHYDTVICNLGSEVIPEKAFEGVDTVIHLAGYAHDLSSTFEREKIYYDVNYTATVDLFKFAIKKSVKNFVYISTVKAGGYDDNKKCMEEIDQVQPTNIYGASKRKAEIEILRLSETSDINVSIIRPALVYGDEMKGNLASMSNAIKKGWFPPIPDSKNRRSMICVYDLIDAIIFIASDLKSNGNIYNATDGICYSSRDIYKALCHVNRKKIPKWFVPKIVFFIMAFVGSKIKILPFDLQKYDKLFSNECYSSKKLLRLGFAPKYNFLSYINKLNSK
jgi:UDP-glucose 4-epimerase